MSQYVIAVYDFGALTNSGAFLPAKQRYHSNSMVHNFSTWIFSSKIHGICGWILGEFVSTPRNPEKSARDLGVKIQRIG